MSKTFILNFGHALSPRVIEELNPCVEVYVGYNSHPYKDPERQVREVMGKAAAIMRRHGGALDGSVPLLVVLPGFSEATALVLAEIAGRTGSLPRVLSLRRAEDGTWGLWSYKDIGRTVRVEHINLERVKLGARGRRGYEKSIDQR